MMAIGAEDTRSAAETASQAGLRALLLEHTKRPHNRRDLPDPSHRGEGSNPLCGDQVQVALEISNGVVRDAVFKGRGCSVCIASASLMTDCVTAMSTQDVRTLCAQLQRWTEGEDTIWSVPPMLAPLGLVRAHSVRRRCLALAWEALADALR
jgi:nitrogen fixation NifU-like protein